MAKVSDGSYMVEGFKINLDLLEGFSSHLPSTAVGMVKRAQDIMTSLRYLPASRHEIDFFQTCLLRSLPVVLTVLYELTTRDEDPPTIPHETQANLTRFENVLDRIRSKFSDTVSAATPHRRPNTKKDLLVASPETPVLQDSMKDLQWAAAPFGASRDKYFVVEVHNPYQVEVNFVYAARLSMVARRTQRFTPDPMLETLPRSKYARFDCERPDRPASCLKGTRRGIIKDTIEWIIYPGPEAKRFFWLKGLAGTGKTTMAYSIANIAQNLGILGASFIFSRRGEAELRDPARVFPTIAYQLAMFDPKFHEAITAALRADPQASTASLKKQLDSLIIEPLSKLQRDDERVVIIVFDAFDECEAVGAKTILQLLVAAIPSLPFFIKIFVTSRPEPHIRSVLIPSNEDLQITALHEIETSIVQGDILHYLRTEIRKLPERKGVDLPPDWVTEVQIELLAHAAGELFIFAATLLRSMEEAYSLPQQLDVLLELATKPRSEDEESNPFVSLDELYTEVLLRPVTRSNRVQVFRLLQVVLGTIVLLRDPLPVDALERLTGMRTGDAHATLNSLHSVILPPAPPDHCPRTYHKSFSDFLQDRARCTDPSLFIETEAHETRLAIRCLQLLNAKLHKGMLGDLDPMVLNSEVRDLEGKVKNAIRAELQYASRHWASHLAKASCGNLEIRSALEEFASKKLLPWMETISWLGNTASGMKCLELAKAWAADSAVSEDTNRLLDDGHQLLLARSDIVALGAQHVWQSVLPFAPANVALTTTYRSSANTGVKVILGVDSDWPSRLTALDGQSGGVISVTLSPDGARLASGSKDNTVRLWDTTTGVCNATLKGHFSWITSVTFSPDGTRLASGSCDHTVRLWDAATGVCTAALVGHSREVTTVTFSPGGSRLASGSRDKTVQLWDATTGVCTAMLTGHSDWVSSVIFSPDGTHIQTQDIFNQTIVWNIHTGGRTENLEWKESNNGNTHGTSAFHHQKGRLVWTSSHTPQRLAL